MLTGHSKGIMWILAGPIACVLVVVTLMGCSSAGSSVREGAEATSEQGKEQRPAAASTEVVGTMKKLAAGLRNYAQEHEQKYPDNLEQARTYLEKEGLDIGRLQQEIAYIGEGKKLDDSKLAVIAYDKRLLAQTGTTYMVSNDGFVEFVNASMLKQMGIGAFDKPDSTQED